MVRGEERSRKMIDETNKKYLDLNYSSLDMVYHRIQ